MIILALLSICQYGGDRSVCQSSDVVMVEDNIVTIPQREFYGWKNIISVVFTSDSALTSIEESAFHSCSNLETINFPPLLQKIGLTAFSTCAALRAIYFPASLRSLGQTSFAYCASLMNITADEDILVTAIPGYAFSCTTITTFAIWKNLNSVSGSAFSNCNSFASFTNPHNNPNFQVIGGILYTGTALSVMPPVINGDFVVPSNVTALLASCCRRSMITSMSFEEGSQMATFGGSCLILSKIHSFTFPDNELVKSISAEMFYGCTNLKTITISDSISSIGQGAFYNSALTFINVTTGHPSFVSIDGVLYSTDCTTITAVPPRLQTTTYTIPKNVTSIANSAFRGSQIFNINFEPGSQLASIGAYAFADLKQSSFTFDPDCLLTSLPNYCFASSSSLVTIDLPRHLMSMEGSAFSDTALYQFLIPNDAEHLISIDGVLYSRDKTVLDRFPPAKADPNYAVPSSVEIIGSSAFATCKGISTLGFARDSKLQTVKASAFASSSIITVLFGDDSDNVVFDAGCFISSSVQYVTLPGRMEVIRTNLFKDCFDLVGITLPESATSIETGAFTNCESLSKLSIPRFCGIRNIPTGAFTNTRSLTEIEIPFLVETIAPNSLPPYLKKLTLWCPLTPSVTEAVRTLATLTDVYILCGLSLDVQFVSSNVEVHHICFTKKLRKYSIGKLLLIVYILP